MNMHNEVLFDRSLTLKYSWIKEVSGLPVLVKGISLMIYCFEGTGFLNYNYCTLKQIEPLRKEIGKDKLLIVDGGIRRGTDVLKCIALGADAVQIGRPVLWGLNYSGKEGVELVLDILLKEFIETMILTGCRNLNEITRDLVREV